MSAEAHGDAADQAAYLSELNLQVALYEHHAHQETIDQIVQNGAVLCVDCGDSIPAARVEAKPDCVRCITCQEIHEKETRLWR